jgi:hydroxymethylbilane synthase
MLKSLTIATRESALALWQAEYVKAALEKLYPDLSVTLSGMTTKGDQILDKPLAAIGGKGLFIKELEVAMEAGKADIAVHSLKDVPMTLPDGFALPAIMAREDPRDAFVSNQYKSLDEMPAGAVVGTSSLRREAQLREKFPKLKIKPLRGNVNTRLKKLDAGEYDAIVLAAAGLIRLGFADRIVKKLDVEDSMPAVGQGALGIECRADAQEVISLLTPLIDESTTLCCAAERAFSRALGGSCQTPLAAHATRDGKNLKLSALVASQDGKEVMRGEKTGVVVDPAQADALGAALGEDFLAKGAARLLP